MARHDINRVIEVGQELFQSQGYFNTGTEEILEKSSYPRSSFYYHFKSKEGFASRVLEKYGDASAAYYRGHLLKDTEHSTLAKLTFLAEALADGAIEREFRSECLVQKLSIECAGMNTNLRAVTDRQMNKMLDVLEESIIEGQNQNEVRKDINAREIARMVQAQVYGSFILGRLANDGEGMKKSIKGMLDYIKK